MIHIKKIILTLALLIAATTQAWAGVIFTSLKVGDVIHVGDQFTISEDWGCINYFFDSYLSPFTLIRANAPDFDPNAAETYVTPDEDGAYYVIQCNYNGETLYGFTYYDRFPATANSDGLVVTNIDTSGMHKVYTFAVHEAYPVPVAWNADTKTGTIAAMPSGNVTISVKYYDQAEFADGLAPAAITGVQASTDNPIVTPGTPKTIGTSSVKMGTVMYYASQTALTDADLLALGTDDWSSSVPKATNLGTGDAYVYYYIQGAEPANVADRSDANTCSDSDIKAANVVNVTLIAPPTYDVSLNKTGLATGEPANWKAKSETVTTEVNLGTNDLEGVTKGETVTVTYTGTRKVIGVKAEKIDNNYMKWDAVQKKLVATEIPATATKVENSNSDVEWEAGTYLVEGDVTIGGIIKLSGDVELIIKDGAKLTANRITGNSDYSLSVYGQAKMSGELNVACSDSHNDAISHMKALNIHSCKVNASSSNSRCGGFFDIGKFDVYGGSVNAEYTGGELCGYGICDTHLNIYGGEVKSVGKGNSDFSYGIKFYNIMTTVKVYGGKLWAECTGNKAIDSDVTFTKDNGYTSGKIMTSADGTYWTVYSGTGTPGDKYVRVGY